MSTLVERIADLKETIEESKSGRDRLEGERDAALKQLKALGCETVEAAEKAVEELDEEVQKLEAKVEKEVTALETEIKKLEGNEDED